ncbi:hypothetical protein SAMN05216226_111102 [Halovenus aranensis]|uniref:Uncharacterized protein n=1 Tax=Halovenus aranensis TaxID=890420 RepID=A0A1G8XKW8_9EURY|nr:hypothetical protein [Halovenus aranensis]SDJ90410.1 hypothetical protein SAMN05216226_111102 [Halovenus aranensis]
MSTSNRPTEPDLVAELDDLDSRYEQAVERVEEFGEADLRELADVYGQFTDVLDRFEEDVTDDGGDIETNIQFQSAIAEVVEEVSEEMLLAEVFEECDEMLQQRWFHESDIREVREQLEPVADLVSRLEERDEILDSYRKTRRDIRYRIRELDEHITDLERLARLADADLDAPTETLREPIETYNDAVTDAFDSFTREASTREVFDFLDAMTDYPLVPFEKPDAELLEYVREHPPGEESIPTLLEYADYSESKLSHYVDEPNTLTRVVGRKQTYLDGLDGGPLTVSWPPPAAEELQYRCRELTAAVNRFAPDVVEQLREVAALPRTTDYERIRDAAVVREDLSEEERERIRSDDIEAELSAARTERETLEHALEGYPDR